MFLFFKKTVKNAQIQVIFFTIFVNLNKLSLSKQLHLCFQRSRIIGGTQIITNKRKQHLFDKIIHFSMPFSAVLNIFIVKT